MADPLNSGLGPAAATATLAPTFRDIYERQLLKNARNNLVHNKFGRKRKLKNGTVMNIRKSTPLAVATTALTEGTPPTALSFEITEQTITALQYGAYIGGTDVVTAVAFDPLLNEISVELGAQAGETIDTVTRDVLVAGSNVQYASTATDRDEITDAMVLSVEELVQGRTTLRTVNVPFRSGQDYDAIIHPLTHADLLRDTTIRAAFNSGDHKSELYDGMIGRFMGIRFHESALAKVFVDEGLGAAVNVYATLIFGKDAYSVADIESLGLDFIFKDTKSGGTSDPLEQKWTSGWKTTHGAAIERSTYMLRIEHGCTNG